MGVLHTQTGQVFSPGHLVFSMHMERTIIKLKMGPGKVDGRKEINLGEIIFFLGHWDYSEYQLAEPK